MLIGALTLRVGSADGLPQLLDTGVQRLDALYSQALRSGNLRPDIGLAPPPAPTPTATPTPTTLDQLIESIVPAGTGATLTLQYDTPGTASVANVEALIRGVSGVRSAATTSLALGGVSLMRVVVDDQAAFAAAMQTRGYQLLGSGTTLRLRRAPQLVPPDLPADGQTTG
jgi:hypothetical protein